MFYFKLLKTEQLNQRWIILTQLSDDRKKRVKHWTSWQLEVINHYCSDISLMYPYIQYDKSNDIFVQQKLTEFKCGNKVNKK